MISHRHLQPVLIRDWAPNYEFYAGHIHESTSTKMFRRNSSHPETVKTFQDRINEE